MAGASLLANFAGPAVVLDARSYLDQASVGASPRIAASVLDEWESEHGDIRPAEIALIDTGYTDKYFRAFPEGNRLLHDPVLNRSTPGWPVAELMNCFSASLAAVCATSESPRRAWAPWTMAMGRIGLASNWA